MFYAQLKNSIVIGVSQISDPIDSPDLIEIPSLDASLLGSAYVNGVFTAPTPAAPAPIPRHISVGAFFDRFGTAKCPILASTDTGVKALITDCSVRKYIDLDNPALPYGLALLIAAGYAIDAEAVANAEIAQGERP